MSDNSSYEPFVRLVDGWILREDGYFPAEESSRATTFSLANGLLGLRCPPEETDPLTLGQKSTLMNGVYDTPEGKLTEREIVAWPDWTWRRISVDGEPMDLETGEVLGAWRELDMRKGQVRRFVRWRAPSSKVLRVETERYLSIIRPHLGSWHARIVVEQAAHVEVVEGIETKVASRWAEHIQDAALEADGNALCVRFTTREPGYELGLRMETRGALATQPVGFATETGIFAARDYDLAAEQRLELHSFASFQASRFDRGDLDLLAKQRLEEAWSVSPLGLRAEHEARWAELWSGSNAVIEGEEAAQMGIRFAIFQLLAAAPWHSDRLSVPARGLQGQDYYGSIFWDFETFVLPLLASTQPVAARNALMYRVHTLAGAQRKARSLGFEGAYYAWQSQETGDDQCDLYVFNDPRTGEPIRSYFADEQIHISGDIVLGMDLYVRATGDETLWRDGGAQVALEVARFYRSRSTWNDEAQRWELRSVLGPDEYHERVNDNAFTNAVAREAVAIALREARHLMYEDEAAALEQWVQTLHVPAPDESDRLIEQFEGYFDLEDEPLAETRARLAHPELHPGGPHGPFQQTQNIKQADVVMLLYLFRDRYDLAAKRTNWEFYEPRTAHDSSLSPMAYSLVAADVGLTEWAHRYFLQTAHIDLGGSGPHWNLGIHAASLGGAWLALVHGFLRVRLEERGVVFEQRTLLPPQWTSVSVRLRWHGAAIEVTATPSKTIVSNLSDREVPVWFGTEVTTVGAGERHSLS